MSPTIIKADGSPKSNSSRKVPYNKQKILDTLISLVEVGHATSINLTKIVTALEETIPNTTTTTELSSLLAHTTSELARLHPDYDILAGQIEMASLYKRTPSSFSKMCYMLKNEETRILTSRFMTDMAAHIQYIDALVDSTPPFPYRYPAFRTIKQLLLLHINHDVVERPSYLFMRTAIHLHGTNIANVVATYNELCNQEYLFDVVLLANAGTHNHSLTSNYSISLKTPLTSKNLYASLTQSAAITDTVGNVSLTFTPCPSAGTLPNGTVSTGVTAIMDLFDSTLAANVSGRGIIQPTIGAYLDIWHADVLKVLDIMTDSGHNVGSLPYMRHTLWLCDIFMKRVEQDGVWSLFSPLDVPLLRDTYGVAFEAAYVAYESDPRVDVKTVSARMVMDKICRCQIVTGLPSIVYKDAVNRRSNHIHSGITTHGGVNADFMQYSSPSETVATHSASIILPSFITRELFDFHRLHSAVESLAFNLNIAIDKSSYATTQAKTGTLTHRPLGIGFEGLADVFIALNLPYDSEGAASLNLRITKTIYHGAICGSVRYAQIHGCYPAYINSPLYQGKFQFDLWDSKQKDAHYNWTELRQRIASSGVANSTFLALTHNDDIPTITGHSPNFQPYNFNVLRRHTYPRRYDVIMPALVAHLSRYDLWNDAMRNQILENYGSVQDIADIPEFTKELFKTSYQISTSTLIELATARAPFICHSQPLTFFASLPTPSDIRTLHFLVWKAGLKTGMRLIHCTVPTESEHECSESEEESDPTSQHYPCESYINIDEKQNTPDTSDSEHTDDSEYVRFNEIEKLAPPAAYFSGIPDGPAYNASQDMCV